VASGVRLCVQDLETLNSQMVQTRFMAKITSEILDRAGHVLRVLRSASEPLPQSGSYCANKRNKRIREIEQEQLWEEVGIMAYDLERLVHGFRMTKYMISLVTNLRQRLDIIHEGLIYSETSTDEPQDKRDSFNTRGAR
ncbi:hypothetical protein CRM22_001171, partial [Opisthorchis felineus]